MWFVGPWLGKSLRLDNSCRDSKAARFSSMSSRRAALDREERSDGETQGKEAALDDRRERARAGEFDA